MSTCASRRARRSKLLCENEPGLQCVHGFEATMTRGPISLVCAIAANNSRNAVNDSRSAANNSSQEVRPATQEMRSTTQEVRPDLQLKNSKCSRQFKKLIKRAMGATSVIAMLVKKPSGRNQLASD